MQRTRGRATHQLKARTYLALCLRPVPLVPQIGAVVVGLDRHISYYKLQYATLCLCQNDECKFIACNTDARGHFSQNQEWAGAGTMVRRWLGPGWGWGWGWGQPPAGRVRVQQGGKGAGVACAYGMGREHSHSSSILLGA